ncbi:MAG: BolA family protein [Acidobacteriota bacterium]
MAATIDRIEAILRDRFRPRHLALRDDSARHAAHPGAASGGGHFEVTIVSERFEGKTLLEQHRMVNEALGELLGTQIHALSLRTIPASEWKGA